MPSDVVQRFYVYVYRDPRPGKGLAAIYVGKGSIARQRAMDHWRRGTSNPLFASVLEKIRDFGATPVIEIVQRFSEESEAHALEIALIKKFGRRDLKTGTLCNLTDGGEGASGSHLPKSLEARVRMSESAKRRPPISEATREKMRRLHSGRKPNQETREKMSAWQRGRKRPTETCLRIGDGHRGKVLSAETRAKMSASRIGKRPSLETLAKLRARASTRIRDEFGRMVSNVS